jgi:HSF-type DNA-binding
VFVLLTSASHHFLLQLMDILADERSKDSISWLPHGKAFILIDKKKLASTILPEYFGKSSKFTSFTRKLNRWYVYCDSHHVA